MKHDVKRISRVGLWLAFAALLFVSVQPMFAEGRVWNLDSGNGITIHSDTEILAKHYPNAISISIDSFTPPFELKRQWDYFESEIGLDDKAHANSYARICLEVDGNSVQVLEVKSYKAPVKVRLPVKDAMELRVRNCAGWGPDSFVRFINPRFIAGDAPPPGDGKITVKPYALTRLANSLTEKLQQGSDLARDGKVQVAVAPFRLIPSDIDRTVQDNVQEDLCTALIDTGRFRIMARGADMARILDDLKIVETGLIDPATAKQLGKMVQAQCVLVGSVSDRGSFAVINCRLINTETGDSDVAAQTELRK